MSEISRQIWDMKYRFRAPDGTGDRDVAGSWARVAYALSLAESPATRLAHAGSFASALAGHKFLPAGRILAGAGTGRAVTLLAVCFSPATRPPRNLTSERHPTSARQEQVKRFDKWVRKSFPYGTAYRRRQNLRAPWRSP